DEQGDRSAAVEHAFRAGDPERTAELVELVSVEMRQYRREATLRRWLTAIPADVLARRPVLAVALAGSPLSANGVDRVDELLTDAERRLGAGEPVVIVDEGEAGRRPGMIQLHSSAITQLQRDSERD